MNVADRLQTRTCRPLRIDHFDRAAAEARLFAEDGTHGDFRIVEQIARPSNETRFLVAIDGTILHVSIITFAAGRGNTDPPGFAILIAPRGDQLGYQQYGIGPAEERWVNHFWPYLDELAPSPEIQAEIHTIDLGPDRAWICHAHIPLPAAARVGFNVMRIDSRLAECAAWNTCSGAGFPDATSAGWLCLGETAAAPAPALVGTGPVALHATYDWPDNMVGGPYTREAVQQELRFLKDHGVTRLYFIDYPGPDYRLDAQGQAHYRATHDALGPDIMVAICELAHDLGLEFYTVAKPYDLPRGDADVSFATAHPELSFRRNPEWTVPWDARPIHQLTLYADNADPLSFDPQDIRLYQSADNRAYTQLTCTVRDDVVTRPRHHHSPAGKRPDESRESVRRLLIDHTAITERYVAIHVPAAAAAGRFGNREFLLAEAALPIELARRSRSDWQREGFVYEQDTHAAVWSDQDDECLKRRDLPAGSVIGLRLGHESHLHGMLDPGHSAVRDHWLQRWIHRAVAAGVDGVDIRIAHHHLCTDWSAFAYAQPVIDRFRETEGRSPTPGDHARIQAIRGAFHHQFLREAKAILAPAGLKLEAHVEARMKVPASHRAYTGIHWDPAAWIDDGVLDGINLKYVGPANPWLQSEILPRARRAGIPVHAIAAIGDPRTQPRTPEWTREWIDLCQAGGVDALNLYELWVYLRTTPAGSWLPRGCSRAIFEALKDAIGPRPSRK